jgi:hypothetical protein
MAEQLQKLAERFDPKVIKPKPGSSGANYISHSVITQRVLEALGAYSITNVELIRGSAPEVKGKNRTFAAVNDVVVGCLLTVQMEIDGKSVTIVDAGSVDNAAMVENDGARAKLATSDALKRCFARVGVGMELWAREHYHLDESLAENRPPEPPATDAWKDWEGRTGALTYAMHIFDAEGTAIFNAGKHAANSYDKLKRAYIEALPPASRPTASSSDEDKAAHEAAFHQLWNQKLIAKFHGSDLPDPEPHVDQEEAAAKAPPRKPKATAASESATV